MDPLFAEAAVGPQGIVYVGRGALTSRPIASRLDSVADPADGVEQPPVATPVQTAEPFLRDGEK